MHGSQALVGKKVLAVGGGGVHYEAVLMAQMGGIVTLLDPHIANLRVAQRLQNASGVDSLNLNLVRRITFGHVCS
jgi:2-polyprenyl-3-methyl-5-hydroxy-6-metoxy-1,4-benzoquinol methylase